MRIKCELEVVYTLALANGGAPSRSSRARASICLGKKPVAPPSGSSAGEGAAKKEELFLIVSTAKNVAGNKYKVRITHSYVDLHHCNIFEPFLGDTVKYVINHDTTINMHTD